jgi:hypothetical protein
MSLFFHFELSNEHHIHDIDWMRIDCIRILKTNVTARDSSTSSSHAGSGIVSGPCSGGTSAVCEILISGSRVVATSEASGSGSAGSGIGSGYCKSGKSEIDEIAIVDSNVTANSSSTITCDISYDAYKHFSAAGGCFCYCRSVIGRCRRRSVMFEGSRGGTPHLPI